MRGLIDRGTKEVRIFYINNDRTKDKILPIVIKNVYSYNRRVINNIDPNENFPSTRIYTNCFSVYQENDFNRLGYILYCVNHSV